MPQGVIRIGHWLAKSKAIEGSCANEDFDSTLKATSPLLHLLFVGRYSFSTAFMSYSIFLADTKAGISHNTVFLVVEQRAFPGSSIGGIYISRFEVVETASRMI